MNEKSFEGYFQNELNKIRELSKEFSLKHPAVAPLLNTHSADPDAQRLLEGVAFLTALLNKKLDDEFPEAIHGLMNILFPHYLRPVPAMSIVEFTPKPSLKQLIKIKKGTIINSTPIDNDIECPFSTTFDIDMYPIELKDVTYESNKNKNSSLAMDIRILAESFDAIKLSSVDFYLSGNYSEATNLFMLFDGFLQKITVEIDDKVIDLPLDALECKGFKKDNSLFEYPSNAFWGYMILQEYFILPQKMFFFTIKNLDTIKGHKSAVDFRVVFHFKNHPIDVDLISKDSIKLFCVPISNLFEEEAEPIVLNHQREMLKVRPPMRYKDKYQVYDVKRVLGYIQGESKQKEYFPFESFEKEQDDKNIYQVHRKISIIDNKEELFLTLYYKEKPSNQRETLSVKITCTNGNMTERLQVGEISKSSDNSPELATFKNIIACTMPIDAPINEESLWQFISHLSINLLTIADLKIFKEMLQLYMFPNNRDKNKVLENKKKIDSIDELEMLPVDMVSRGYLLKGHKVKMSIRKDYFASIGDLYLFCSVILRFLSNYASLNTFVELEVKEKITGEIFRWKPMLGNKKLI